MSKQLVLVHIKQMFVWVHAISSIIKHKVKVVPLSSSLMFGHHKHRDQQEVLHSNQSIILRMVNIQQIIGLVHSSSSIKQLELAIQFGNIKQMVHRNSKDLQLVVSTKWYILP